MAERALGEAPVFTAGGIRALDADLARTGLLELTMEQAGARVAGALNRRFPEGPLFAGPVLVLAGGGANGGDAYVAARHLHAAGREVRVLALASSNDLARAMRDRLTPFVAVDALMPETLGAALDGCDLVLDGLLGTGFGPPLRPELAQLVELLNAAHTTVVSIDLPSGLNADAAGAQPGHVRADLTLALVGLKPALLFGADHSALGGEVQLLDLSVPPELLNRHRRAWSIGEAELRALLPRRARGAHKGDAGKLYVLGGQSGYTGAPAMTALAALRTGAGLVSLYSRAAIPGRPLEAMAHRLERWDALDDLPKPGALAAGMGLRQEGEAVARRVLTWHLPTVLDADALQPALAGAGHDQVVWTPHPGEAACCPA